MRKDQPIRRFPREPEDYPEMAGVHLSQLERLKLKVARGKTPKGYNRLTRKQKRVARLVISGMSVHDVCDRYSMDSNTFYRWLHCHKLFQKFYYKLAQRSANNVENRLDARLNRAVQVIEESLDSRDPYFAQESAFKLLRGRGKLKQSIQTKSELSGNLHVEGHAIVENLGGSNKELAMAFLEMMARMSQGGVPVQPKVIDIKKLPPAAVEVLRGSSQVQDGQQAEAVGKD